MVYYRKCTGVYIFTCSNIKSVGSILASDDHRHHAMTSCDLAEYLAATYRYS